MKMKFSLRRISLTARLAAAFFLLVLFTIGVVGYVVYVQATNSLTHSVYERLKAVSVLKEDDFNRWVDSQRLNLVFLAWQPEVQRQVGILLSSPSVTAQEKSTAHTLLLNYLQFVVTSVSDSDELLILGMDGQVALSTMPEHEGQSHAQDLFFTQGQSSTYVQPVYTSRVSGRPTITVATPLFDENKRRVGVLAAHLNQARIDRVILERTGLGNSGETYLVNPTYEFVSAANLANPQVKPGSIRSVGIDAALGGADGEALYTNYQGVPVVGVYNWLDDREVALMVEISQAEAFAPARQLALNIDEFGLVASLVMAVAAYLLARSIARPILGITATALRVAAGDLTQMAPVETQDEVGVLAKTFNLMTRQLRLLYENLENKVAERTAELTQVNGRLKEEIAVREQVQESLRSQKKYLEALHETSLGLISRLDLHELFGDLVRRAGALMDTSHGFIYIVEPGEDEIECKVGVGIFTRLIGFRLTRGKGLGGTIWQTGVPVIINDYDRWSDRAQNMEFGLIRNIIGVPLTSGSQVVGVIGLAYERSEPVKKTFGEYEVEQLTRFAHLASIALDNARLYTAAKEARAAAEAANQAKSAFLANVSHELRTPLTSIVGFTHILRKRFTDQVMPHIPPAEVKTQRAAKQIDENLGIILTEGERLTELINNLLDLEKIQAGKMTWNMATVHLQEVIQLAAAATASLFENKGLVWVQDLSEALPDIIGDRNRLEQVLINLISNAVKFSDSGSITCRARWMGDEIVVSLQDQGVGIAKDDFEQVFEKFKQVGDTLTNKPKGTGLGLSICKEIIEHHGGRMWLESEPGRGSTFYFSLPLQGPATHEPSI